jgi:alcohol dehydrogenase (cytochrome c)
MDRYLRALDIDRGEVLWETRLPSQVVGGTITFSVNGRQYIAVTSGGGAIASYPVSLTRDADTASGANAVYVFALPQ